MLTQYTDKTRKLGFLQIKKQIIIRFRHKQYDELEQDLSLYKLQSVNIQTFFQKEGFSLLYWSLVNASDSNPINFLQKNISNDVLWETLASNQFSILKSFLNSQAGIESLGWNSQNNKEIQTEKFVTLLKINCSELKAFLESKDSEQYITSDIVENFREATKRFNCSSKI